MIVCPRDCYDTCFHEISAPNLRLLPTNIPVIRVSCPRAIKDFDRVFSAKRVLYPHYSINKRRGLRKRVSWDFAIRLIVRKLKETLMKHGPSSVLFLDYAGNRGIFTRYVTQRLWYLLGVARIDYSICDGAGEIALKLHYGSTYGALPRHMSDARLLVYWGFNAAVTSIHNFAYARKLRREKNTLIVTIDTLKTETAGLSDVWLRPRYGTDTFLALGIANYIIENDLHDIEFIEQHTYGFKEFRKYVRKFNLDFVSEKTQIPKDRIIEFAELYAERKPSIIFIGYGLQRRVGGGETVRAISLLPALIGIHRGFYYGNIDGLLIDLKYITGSFLGKPSRIIPQSKIGEHIARGEFKFIYIHLTNPAATHPRAELIKEGLLREDVFVVVHETHWSDTAELADIVLPAPTWLEKFDAVFSYWHNFIGINKPIIKPQGESKTEFEVMQLIAKELGINNRFIFEEPLSILRNSLDSSTFEKLMKNGYTELPYRSLIEYQTPTGRIEFLSTKARDYGVDPLPRPIEVKPPPEYPYILVSSAHIKYTHTQFEDVYGPIPPIIQISEDDMRRIGVESGEKVLVTSRYGSVVLLAEQSDRVPGGVVFAYRSCRTLDGKRLNYITRDEVNELGGATINTTFVNIEKIR